MPKAKHIEEAAIEPADTEGVITYERTNAIWEHLEQLRRKRAYQKLIALKGKIKINIDIDELRGRNRR